MFRRAFNVKSNQKKFELLFVLSYNCAILYLQKIRGSSVEPGLKLFGSAIAGTVDMDGNDYPGKLQPRFDKDKVPCMNDT